MICGVIDGYREGGIEREGEREGGREGRREKGDTRAAVIDTHRKLPHDPAGPTGSWKPHPSQLTAQLRQTTHTHTLTHTHTNPTASSQKPTEEQWAYFLSLAENILEATPEK